MSLTVRNNSRGFSLLELMIAMTILSLLTAMIFITISSANETTAAIARRAAQSTESRAVLDEVSGLLRAGRPLGTCIDPPSSLVVPVPLSACRRVGEQATAIYPARTDSDTVCVYAYRTSSSSPTELLTAPDLACVELNATTNELQILRYAPKATASYTDVDSIGWEETAPYLTKTVANLYPESLDLTEIFSYFDSLAQPAVPSAAVTLIEVHPTLAYRGRDGTVPVRLSVFVTLSGAYFGGQNP